VNACSLHSRATVGDLVLSNWSFLNFMYPSIKVNRECCTDISMSYLIIREVWEIFHMKFVNYDNPSKKSIALNFTRNILQLVWKYFYIFNFPAKVLVREVWKSVHTCQRNDKTSGSFLAHGVTVYIHLYSPKTIAVLWFHAFSKE